jgi:lipoprotein-anchoring transpeptidase ErfK/SrfK
LQRLSPSGLRALALVALSAAAPAPVLAQDPIAAALEASGPASAPPTNPARSFSPQAIADLLRQDDAKTAATRASGIARPVGGVSRPLDVPVTADSAPDPSAPSARPPVTAEMVNTVRFGRVNEAGKSVDPVVLKAEVLLDRAHAPPGVIDGRYGSNFTKAITTFETVRGLPVDGKLTRRVWDELGGDTAAPVLGTYTIKPEDVVGPFYPDLPADYALQAQLPDLGYRSANEMFGERFHMDRKFLKALNPGVDMATAGNTIVVAQVETLPLASQIARIDVDKAKGQVLAYDPQGDLVVAYPATIGSDELPSPSGSYVVRGIAPHPTYTYDPVKNFQQGSNVKKLILPPGPNNPVGAAFIALSKPTYGIHGTPDPSKIDKTRSHGCVRLTNWNAQELAGLVKVGVPVNFLDKPGTEGPPEPDIAAMIGADAATR